MLTTSDQHMTCILESRNPSAQMSVSAAKCSGLAKNAAVAATLSRAWAKCSVAFCGGRFQEGFHGN